MAGLILGQVAGWLDAAFIGYWDIRCDEDRLRTPITLVGNELFGGVG
jgi:hypothetical protein